MRDLDSEIWIANSSPTPSLKHLVHPFDPSLWKHSILHATRERYPDLLAASALAVANRKWSVHAEGGTLPGALRDVEL